MLECGHLCKGNCSLCFHSQIHIPCQEPCKEYLVCGHKCKSLCGEVCYPCNEKCKVKCTHSHCNEACGKPCVLCNEKCDRHCNHGRCSKLCKEKCDYVCNEKCNKKLECGHNCIGICGETCPKKCRICNKDEVEQILFGNEDDPDSLFIELPECHHIVEVKGMDRHIEDYVSQNKREMNRRIEFPTCPKCKTPIITCERYHSLLNEIQMDIEKVKSKKFDEIMNITDATRHNINIGFPTDDVFKPFIEINEKINNDVDLIWNNILNDTPDYDLIYRNYYYSVSYNNLIKLFKVYIIIL